MGVTEEGGTARGMLKERGDLKMWKETPCWKNGRVNVKEEVRGCREIEKVNQGGKCVTWRLKWERERKKDQFSARLFREREMDEKVGARRGWTKKDDDSASIREGKSICRTDKEVFSGGGKQEDDAMGIETRRIDRILNKSEMDD